MPPAQQKQRFDYAYTNNNDQKYLHKKFKKIASTVAHQPLTENEVQNKELDRSSCSSQPTTYKVSAITQGSLALTNVREDEYNTQVYEARIQNNVQTKFKDIYHVTNPPVTFERSHSDWNDKKYIEEKNSIKTDTCETDVSNAKDITVNVGYSGRYICPYCKLSCAKPSVLQKHIRAHTNERPYPCVPCGFAFKTKSNLYKHCRSRTHALRLQGGENIIPSNEDDWSMGSESDTSLPAAPLSDASVSVDAVSLRMDTAMSDVSSPESILLNERVTPPNTSTAPLSQTEVNKSKAIYKPKFHKASLYQDEEQKLKKMLSPNSDFLNQHISKIISDNEAIVETIDSPLQKKYSKITNLQKQIALNDNMNNITMSESPKHESQPLNLTKDISEETIHRKRCYSESFANQEQHKVLQHPLNPEGSIIKDLLLKARAGLMPVTQETYDPTETLYICPLCQIPYRSAGDLEIHQLYYCKSNRNLNGLGTSQNTPKESKIYRPEHIYMRSNSVNVTLPESYTPNTLAKLATSTLKSPIGVLKKPDNLVIIKPENDIAAPLPSPGPLLGNTRLVDSRIRTGNANKSAENNLKTIKPLTSPKRRSEITLDKFSPLSIENKGGIQRFDMYSPQNKMRCMETNPTTLRSLEELSLAPMRQNSTSLQMFGGEVKIVDNSGEIRTFRIEADNRSPTLVPQSSPNNTQNKVEQTEKSSIVVRSGLHSGGTIVQNMPTPKETDRSPMPSTPRISMSMASNISSPSFSLSGIPTPNITHFQFPPLGSITAFNPLTLPALSPSLTPNGATTILHGGKLIPYVPGIPGPNTPSSYISAITSQSKYMQSPESHSFSPAASKEDIYARLNISSPKAKIPKHDFNLPIRASVKSPNTRIVGQDTVEKSRVSSLNNQKPIESNIENKTSPIPTVKIVTVDNNPQVRVTSVNGYLRRQDSLQRSSAVRDSLSIDVSEGGLKEIHKDSSVTNKFMKIGTPEKEIRNFNFENFISKSEIYNNVSGVKSVGEDRLESSMQPLTVAIQTFERSETSYFKKSNDTSSKSSKDDTKNKFLRPSSLPLKPGTFIPKKHHGITPNANTMPLISPETPRPAKAYGQLYLNGHAYTYLGLKCSTKVYYCTLNRPQPTYVPNQHSLSMYSNWQICSEAAPHPLGLSAGRAMAQYDSRHRPQTYTISNSRQELRLTHSSQWNNNPDVKQTCTIRDIDKSLDGKQNSDTLSRKELAGGFESNEEYTYVRGRGRGRYVCSECGIRCKKPSMLKKHIRTHTDVRPYTCKHCVFSFKTKGNLTKHMKSKAHYKKCCELGISPSEGAEVREGVVEAQGSGDTDEETDSDADDGNEGETESSDTDSWKSRLPEHEAAQGLLSLWGAPPSSAAPGLLTSARPSTYPYTPSEHHDHHADPLQQREPMDLSKSDLQHTNITRVVTAPREPSVLASLAQNTAKLPKHQNHWGSGEPMLHAYLTEKALQDSKIKESQYTASKLRKLEEARQSHIRISHSVDGSEHTVMPSYSESVIRIVGVEDRMGFLSSVPSSVELINVQSDGADNAGMDTLADIAASSIRLSSSCKETEDPKVLTVDIATSTENAKFVASEYLKMASGKGENLFDRNTNSDGIDENSSINVHHIDDNDNPKERKDGDVKKMHAEHTPVARNVVVGAGGVVPSSVGDYAPTSVYAPVYASGHLADDGRSVCAVCNKSFLKPSQLRLHINIHYMERPFRCSACAVSFRTRGHLQKHERSGSHHNKVSMTSTFGTATSSNPRPFKCSDCKIAFRIHGHLAKHLRSKMHVMRLECLGKLPFGTFAEIEREGVSLTDIDTTDCANSLASLQLLAQKLHEKDPTKLESWDPATMVPPLLPAGRESSDEDEPSPVPITKYSATDT